MLFRSGKQCEFTQAGVEMLGAANPSADAEILALAIKALLETGIKDFKLSIGQIDFINGLLEDAKLSESNAKEVKKALIKHDVVKLENLIETSTIEPKKKELLKRLPFLHGDIDLLTEVLNYDLNEKSKNAIADLKAIYDLLKVYGVTEYLSFDLGLLRDFDYYTGMLFEGYAMEIGFPIIGGGRYDKMMQNFGEPAPATGFAIGMDRVMLVVSRQNYCYNVKKANIFVGYADNCLLKAIKKVEQTSDMTVNDLLKLSLKNI